MKPTVTDPDFMPGDWVIHTDARDVSRKGVVVNPQPYCPPGTVRVDLGSRGRIDAPPDRLKRLPGIAPNPAPPPLVPDRDMPERRPTVVPLWVDTYTDDVNVVPNYLGTRVDILMPFPWFPQINPAIGLVFANLWGDRLTPAEALAMAKRGASGWSVKETPS